MMKISLCRLLAALVPMLLMNPSTGQVRDAAAYPNRAVKVVVPFPPGGAADQFARLVSEHASKSLGQSFVVDNRPGAGGQIATDQVAKAAADGHTLLVATVGHAVNPSLYTKLPYDTLRDLTAVAKLADLPSVLVINPTLPVKSVRDLIDLMKSKPGSISYASSGNATTSHVAAAMFASQAKVEGLHVPYKGSAPAVTDLIGGQVQMMIDPVLSSAQHVRSGKLRALAVSTAKRSPIVPDLPTIAESGLPGYDFSSWFVLLAPAKTPPDIVDRLNREVARILALPEVKERYAALGAEPGSGSSAEVNAFLAAEVRRYATVVREAHMKVD